MTRIQTSAVAIVFGALLAGPAMAADNAPVTRSQVKVELAEAINTGNMIIGESGELYNEAFPHNYPAQNVESKTRAQVRAELVEAIQNGNMTVNEAGELQREVFALNFPAPDVAGKTREEVRAEVAEAAANGSLHRHIPA